MKKNSNFLKKILLAIVFVMCTSCAKTIKIKTDIISGLEYIEPRQCIKPIKPNKKYKTVIIDNKVAFDNENLGIFLQNISDYQISINEYIQCSTINENYYKNIMKKIIV